LAGIEKKKVLVAPLDWGLGHAGRCIPIIRILIKEGHDVIIGGSGKSLQLLMTEFPDIKRVEIPNFEIDYAPNHRFMNHFIKKVPEMLLQVQKENSSLKSIIDQHNIDVVISDNRYGLQNEKIKSIVVCHQINLQLPWGASPANWLNRKMLRKFDEIWVPDFQGEESLAGKLSVDPKNELKQVRYIGPLSRFTPADRDVIMDLDFLAMISGPEPQRTILDKIIQNQTEHTYYSGVIVQGLPEDESYFKLRDGIQVYTHLQSAAFKKMIDRSKVVIARAGYSTIMEMAAMGKPAILIPTPGQPEQEYLAEHLKHREQFIFVKQKHWNLPRLLTRSFPAIKPAMKTGLTMLEKAIKSL